MGHDTLTQPLLRNQARLASGEVIIIDGKQLQCGGTECPWMTTDTVQRSQDMKKLSRAVAFCVTFMILEVVGGIRAGSLAILTDAAHLLSDVASFAISLFAMWAGGWEANLRQTYGFFRLEILGALVSIQIIWLITGVIVYEALVRLVREPVEIDGRLMFIIASLGLVVNLIMMFLLGHDHGGHSHAHDHGHSHGSSNNRSQEHKHSEDHHDHGQDHTEDHDHHHRHGEEHDLESHDHEEQPSENHHHGEKQSHHHAEDEQGHVHHDHGHQDKDGELHDESMESHTSNGLDQNAAVVLKQSGHKTACLEKNITKSRRSKSGDTIIMCICDQLETRSESDSSVRVTIDRKRNHDDHDESTSGSSINVRGAYLHVLGDLIQSIGVMVGGAVIWYKPEWKIVDLLCTFFFSIVVLGTTIKMIRDILEVLMESTPREVDAGALQSGLMDIEGVIAVHELHIWAITVGKVVLACHVMIRPDADSDDLLEKVIQYCDRKFKISHVTIQIERLKE